MKADGTVVLWLRATQGSIIGHFHLVYAPDHPEYAAVIRHLGGLSPGETKPVPPWPDEPAEERQ